ncbi:hypothetical protein [Paenibacillus luteus]|nr:hypothetical protein [Paenibacillus luteus]
MNKLGILIIILLVFIIVLLLRINSKLPGRDLAKEAIERYEAKKKQNR